MAKDSKAKRHERRLRRQNTLYRTVLQTGQQNDQLRQMLQLTQHHASSVRATLYAILTQRGGCLEAAFTKGTMEQVQANFARLSVEIVPTKEDPDTYNVLLVEAPVVATTDTLAPAATNS